MFLTAVTLMTLLSASQLPSPEPGSAAKVEKAVLARRRSIRTGTVSCESTVIQGGETKPGLVRSVNVWFDYDKDRLRADVVRYWKNRNEAPYRLVQCRNCERPQYLVEHTEERLENGVPVLCLVPLKFAEPARQNQLFDPRLLGLVPIESAGLRYGGFETILGRPDRENPTLRRESLKGQECWVVSFHTFQKVFIEAWVVPSQAYNVARIVSTTSYDGSRGDRPLRPKPPRSVSVACGFHGVVSTNVLTATR